MATPCLICLGALQPCDDPGARTIECCSARICHACAAVAVSHDVPCPSCKLPLRWKRVIHSVHVHDAQAHASNSLTRNMLGEPLSDDNLSALIAELQREREARAARRAENYREELTRSFLSWYCQTKVKRIGRLQQELALATEDLKLLGSRLSSSAKDTQTHRPEQNLYSDMAVAFYERLAIPKGAKRIQVLEQLLQDLTAFRLTDDTLVSCRTSSAALITCMGFNRPEHVLAVGDASRQVRLYDAACFRAHPEAGRIPMRTISTPAKIRFVVVFSSKSRSSHSFSGLHWNTVLGHLIAVADYDGGVHVFDAGTGVKFWKVRRWVMRAANVKLGSQTNGHSRRAWSVFFSQHQPSMFASGSSDYSGEISILRRNRRRLPHSVVPAVRIWQLQQQAPISSLDIRANACSVEFHPLRGHVVVCTSCGTCTQSVSRSADMMQTETCMLST
jgi:hypothetical protein